MNEHDGARNSPFASPPAFLNFIDNQTVLIADERKIFSKRHDKFSDIAYNPAFQHSLIRFVIGRFYVDEVKQVFIFERQQGFSLQVFV